MYELAISLAHGKSLRTKKRNSASFSASLRPIDERHSVPTFPKVNNSCINTYWIEIQCSSCFRYR